MGEVELEDHKPESSPKQPQTQEMSLAKPFPEIDDAESFETKVYQ